MPHPDLDGASEAVKDLHRAVSREYDAAVERFFEKVDSKRQSLGLTETDVEEAISRGIDSEVAGWYREWCEDD